MRQRATDPRGNFRTPLEVYRPLDAEFGFNLDAAAEPENALCERFFTIEDDALKQDWGGPGTIAFCNPPYVRGQVEGFVKKAYEESLNGATVVMLIYHDNRTRWWRKWVEGKAEIRRWLGYISFLDPDGKQCSAKSQMPCAVLVYRGMRQVRPLPDKMTVCESDRAILLLGDCLKVSDSIPEDTIDAVITDPPSGKKLFNLHWDGDKGGRDKWIGWMTAVLRRIYPTMKPGAFALLWTTPTTAHWTATAVEDAGLVIVDVYAHLHAQGLSKSSGRLKPSREDWIIAQKPFHGTIQANLNKWGVGRLFPDQNKLPRDPDDISGWAKSGSKGSEGYQDTGSFSCKAVEGEEIRKKNAQGRHPTNTALSEESPISKYFYCPKASAAEREEGKHPAQKPVNLMRHLVKLVTQPGQTVFDPFMGSGTTGVAAVAEGRLFVGIEAEEEHFQTACRRIQ